MKGTHIDAKYLENLLLHFWWETLAKESGHRSV